METLKYHRARSPRGGVIGAMGKGGTVHSSSDTFTHTHTDIFERRNYLLVNHFLPTPPPSLSLGSRAFPNVVSPAYTTLGHLIVSSTVATLPASLSHQHQNQGQYLCSVRYVCTYVPHAMQTSLQCREEIPQKINQINRNTYTHARM